MVSLVCGQWSGRWCLVVGGHTEWLNVEALFLLSPTRSVEMNEDYKYDDTFMSILREEGQIIPFLDAIFGFLHRR